MDSELKQIGSPEQFTPTQWNNSSGPAISADQLNRLEKTLVVLLGSSKESNNTGVVQQLVLSNNNISDILDDTKKQLNDLSTEITNTYATKDELSGKANTKHTHVINEITDAPDFSTYAIKTEIPSDLRDLTDADGIYAKISDIPENISDLNNDLKYVVEDQLSELASKNHTHKVEEITDIAANYATRGYVDEKVKDITGVDFDNYYTKDETVGLEDTITLNCGNAATLIN